MGERSDQLDDRGWTEDRRTSMPDIENEEMRADSPASSDSETERIKAEIEDTRAEMGQTINEIQERLSPEHLLGQVKETVRDATIGKVERAMDRVGETISNVTEPAMNAMGRAGETLKGTGYSITNTVKQNPIACTLIGLGLGMYVVNRFRGGDVRSTRTKGYRSGFEYGRTKSMGAPGTDMSTGRESSMTGEYAGASRQYGQTGSARGMLSQMKDSAGGLAHDAGEKMSELGHQATEGARWAGRGLQRLMQENPLAVSAAAVAVGAAVGLALPTTRMEHEYMGEASERLVDRAQQAAHDAMDRVKTATQGESGNQPQAGQATGQQAQSGQQAQGGQQGQQQTGQQRTGQQQSGPQSAQSKPGQRSAGM
ncbi:MAG TPA: DUF3618 domain-containing protein [Pyrinomonadaceae bacterium]|nr:DUF3618 domain-containing protein [Pyrinomonadaceae bacterium]